jgi:hypothetical protein
VDWESASSIRSQRRLVFRPLSLDVSFAGLLVLPLGQPLSSVALRVLQLMRMQLTEDQKVLSVFVRRPVLATALWPHIGVRHANDPAGRTARPAGETPR